MKPTKTMCVLLGLTLAFTAASVVPTAAAACNYHPGPVVGYRLCTEGPDLVHVWVLGDDLGDPLP